MAGVNGPFRVQWPAWGEVSSIDSGQLDILEVQITPFKPEMLTVNLKFRFGIKIQPVNAEKLMCSSYFGILLILSFSRRDHAAFLTRMSRNPHP